LPDNIPLAYIDESGVEQDLQPTHGRALRGVKIYGCVNGRKYGRVNIIGARFNGNHVGILTYNFTTDSGFFEAWFEMWLLPLLPKGTAIMLDNASFHRKSELYKIANEQGYILIFLPPYSPDKNPIELSWANMKRWLRKNASNFATIQAAIDAYFSSA
jgi:hypothetical protein